MLRFPVFILALLMSLSLAGCDSAGKKVLDHAEVRLVNETGFDLDSAKVKFSIVPDHGPEKHEQILWFDALPRGEGTEYRPLEGGHVYDFTIAWAWGLYGLPFADNLSPMFGEDGKIHPISVGPGRYTYRLQLEPYRAPVLDLEFPNPTQPDAPADTVEIRVENLGERAFEAVALMFPNGPESSETTRVEYGALPAGRMSEYIPVAFSYRYALAEVVVAGDTVSWEPIDFVGEDPLEPGKYTFGLSVRETTKYRDRTTLEREGDR